MGWYGRSVNLQLGYACFESPHLCLCMQQQKISIPCSQLTEEMKTLLGTDVETGDHAAMGTRCQGFGNDPL